MTTLDWNERKKPWHLPQ